jgi:carbon monoxide dehydrogenase subunit G
MVQVDRTIHVGRPPEAVFDFLTDPHRAAEWSSTVSSASTDGEIDVGATFDVEARFLGQRLHMTCEVVEHERPSRYYYQADRPMRLVMGGTIEESDGGCELCVSVDVDPGKVFAVAGPLFKRQVRKQLEADLERLKDVLESE